MRNSKNDPSISALLVGEYESDLPLLRGVFRDAGWLLWEAPDRARALACLKRHPVQVVISEKDGPCWHWKKVLRHLRKLAHPPQLIVTSRIADDSFWAEVLNVGGYDVLSQPFHPDEVERVVAAAGRHFEGAISAPPLAAMGTA